MKLVGKLAATAAVLTVALGAAGCANTGNVVEPEETVTDIETVVEEATGTEEAPATAEGPAIAEGSGDPVTIDWWHIGTAEPLYSFWNNVASEFEAEHPGVTVNVSAFNTDEFANTLLPNTFAGGANPPDLFQSWGGGMLGGWVDSGNVMDITDAAASTISRVGPAAESWSEDGRVYGLPYTFGPGGFWYNRDLFEQAGITETPQTLDEFYEAIDKLKAAGITPIAIGAGDVWPAAFYWYQFVMKTVPADIVSHALATGDFSDPHFDIAGQYLREFVEHDPFQNGWQTASASTGAGSSGALVATGQAAMELMGAWAPGTYAGILAGQGGGDADEPPAWLDWMPFPSIPGADGDPTAILGGGDGFSVHRDAPPETLALLDYILSVDVQRRFAELGNIPVVAGAEDALEFEPQRRAFDALESADTVQLWLDTSMPDSGANAMRNAIIAFMGGQGTPRDIPDAISAAW